MITMGGRELRPGLLSKCAVTWAACARGQGRITGAVAVALAAMVPVFLRKPGSGVPVQLPAG